MRVALVSPNDSFASVACVICTWYVSFVSTERTDIGAQIRKARDAAGISQVELAIRLKRGERTVQAWERNERTPRLGALTEMANELGQSVAFFYGSGEPVKPNGDPVEQAA